MNPARLEAKDLVVLREGRRILDGTSLSVARGEIAVIEGPSGGGKSTLLRGLATLIEIDAGSLVLDGVNAAQLSPHDYRRRVGYVPQQPLMLEGTVADNIATGPRLAGRSLAPSSLSALLVRAGLGDAFAQRGARELSGGEQQRVALARALANEPEVILLDEPTAALDRVSARHILETIQSLARAEIAVVVVTHIDEHARALNGKRYELEQGRLRERAS